MGLRITSHESRITIHESRLLSLDLEAQRKAVEFPQTLHLAARLVQLEICGERPALFALGAQLEHAAVERRLQRARLRAEVVQVGELYRPGLLTQIDLHLAAGHSAIPRAFPNPRECRFLCERVYLDRHCKQRAHKYACRLTFPLDGL